MMAVLQQDIKLHSVDVPAKSTLVVIGKDSPIYLEEGDQIEANAGHTIVLTIVISYEELDDGNQGKDYAKMDRKFVGNTNTKFCSTK